MQSGGASGEQAAGQRRAPVASSKSICADGMRRPSATLAGGLERSRPLMHSVSIVVELAQRGSCDSSSPPPDTPACCPGEPAAGAATREGVAGSAGADGERRRLEKLVTSGVGAGAGGARSVAASPPGKSVESDEEGEKSDRSQEEEEENEVEGVEEGEEQEEEEDDDEEDCCLSSSLARRVVLVDEADKIFLRNRAQSADPHCAPAYLVEAGRSHTPLSVLPNPSRPPSSTAASVSSQWVAQEARLSRHSRHSVATISPGALAGANWRPAGASGNSPLGAANSSELAERGQLRQLSMRRHTQHQVNFGESARARQSSASFSFQHQPLVMRSSNSLNQQQQQQTDASKSQKREEQFDKSRFDNQLAYKQFCAARSTIGSAAASHASSKPARLSSAELAGRTSAAASSNTSSSGASASRPPPIQHRRQSLQINLLGSLARDTSRSLTEEELRGEREFNEQLRCAARSPDLFNALKQLHAASPLGAQNNQLQLQLQQQHVISSALPPVPFGALHAQLRRHNSQQQPAQQQPARCQSTSGCWPALARDSPATSPATGSHSLQPQPQPQPQQRQVHLQTISPNSAASRRRRVSFGSIDPIVPAGGRDQCEVSPASANAGPLQQAAASKRQRASICSSLLASQHQQQLGILRKLAAPHQQAQPLSRMAQREMELAKGSMGPACAQDELASSSSCPRRNRLASVGEPSAVESLELQSSARSETVEPLAGAAPNANPTTAAARRHHSKSISSAGSPGAPPVANDDSRVRSIMANAKLRQEEFARLLEEHEQIVNEINKFETKISSGAAAAAAAAAKQQEQSGQL